MRVKLLYILEKKKHSVEIENLFVLILLKKNYSSQNLHSRVPTHPNA